MDDLEFYDVIETDIADEFLKTFGGVFIYDMRLGPVYNYANDIFQIPKDLKELIQKSIDTNENLLFKLKKLKYSD